MTYLEWIVLIVTGALLFEFLVKREFVRLNERVSKLEKRVTQLEDLNAFHARAKFSGIGKQSAAILNSSDNFVYLSAANVVAVCQDGSPLAFFEAKPRLNSPFFFRETTSSSLERKIAADESVSCLLVRCLYHLALLIFMASHGWVRDSDSLCERAPRSRRRRSW
jgi:hypothetical protein